MRKAFTLIELMIVIAIIAIIAAIAIPNLLESRITANEASAATSLKSGVLPGQVQFQAGAYLDGADNDGRGMYAPHVAAMSGATTTGASVNTTTAPNKALSLLDPKFNNTLGQAGNTTYFAVTTSARVGAYDFAILRSTANEDNAESYWGGIACPRDTTGNEARRAFGINTTGTIYQTKQTVELSSTVITTLSADGQIFASDPTQNVAPVGGNAAPYQK